MLVGPASNPYSRHQLDVHVTPQLAGKLKGLAEATGGPAGGNSCMLVEERVTAGGHPCDIGGCTLRHKECQWPKWALALVPMTSVRRSLCGLYAPTKGAFTWKS